jgi:uncharacterized membrane protein YvbJ
MKTSNKMKTQIDYCTICRDTTKCKKCRKNPFQKSSQYDADADADTETSGAPENLFIAVVGAVIFLIIVYVSI